MVKFYYGTLFVTSSPRGLVGEGKNNVTISPSVQCGSYSQGCAGVVLHNSLIGNKRVVVKGPLEAKSCINSHPRGTRFCATGVLGFVQRGIY